MSPSWKHETPGAREHERTATTDGAVVAPAHETPRQLLVWVLRLRWLALAGQALGILLARWPLGLDLPYPPLLGILVVTALTQGALVVRTSPWGTSARSVLASVLVLDVVSFTLLLQLTGGPDNPFAMLYAIHVALAAMALGGAWTWILGALAAAGYTSVFVWHVPADFWHAPLHPALSVHAHLAGMWLAMVTIVAVVAYSSARVSDALREREQQIERARLQASRNERLAALGTLAAGAAHELGSPLGTIAVAARELERAALRRPDGEPLAEDARLVRREADRCRDILRRMSARTSEVDRGPEWISIDRLLEGLRAEVGAGARMLVIEHGRAVTGETLVPRDLSFVLQPVVRNAIDAAGGGAPVRVRFARVGERLRISVHDRGAGMDAETARRAGDPFFTTKPPGAGTGLGLHVARLVTERLGGRIRLRSVPGRGTCVRLDLPRRAAAAERDEADLVWAGAQPPASRGAS